MATITKPFTFVDATTANAADVNQNFDEIYDEFNGNISSDNLADGAVTTAKIADAAVTIAKLSGIDMTDYTPTLTGMSIGNGTMTASYLSIGKLTIDIGTITLGSTSTKTGNFAISTPVTAKSGTTPLGIVYGNNSGVKYYMGVIKSTSIFSDDSTGQWSNIVPFTWGTGDNLSWVRVIRSA